MDRLTRSGILDAGAIPFVGLTIALTLLVAAASYYLIERHAIRFGHRLARRTAGASASVAAPEPPADAPASAVVRGG
jgi:peptidoglycan/LPS O-acetylase OafA/YrhL